MLRPTILLALLSGLAWWLHGEQGRGAFREVDETFLDFLIANTRDQLKPDPAKLGDVVFVRLREEDKKEYAGWPPLPIDYLMVAKGLAAFEPSVLVIADPLTWPEPKPDSLPELAQTLLPIPSVVIGVEASSAGVAPPDTLAFVKDHLPALDRLQGNARMLPGLHQLARLPEPVLVPQRDIGVVTGPPWSMALRYEDHAVPSLVLAALSRATRTPFAHQRLRTGPGAGVHLGAALFVPLADDGSLLPSTQLQVPNVNGLELMTATMIDPDTEIAKTLGKGRTMVVGIDNDSPAATAARVQAQAIATALALPRVRVLTLVEQITVWALAALLGLGLLWRPKKALGRMLLLLFAALTASYLAFQGAMIWCPPAIPAALLAAAGVFARLFGKKSAAQPCLDPSPTPH